MTITRRRSWLADLCVAIAGDCGDAVSRWSRRRLARHVFRDRDGTETDLEADAKLAERYGERAAHVIHERRHHGE